MSAPAAVVPVVVTESVDGHMCLEKSKKMRKNNGWLRGWLSAAAGVSVVDPVPCLPLPCLLPFPCALQSEPVADHCIGPRHRHHCSGCDRRGDGLFARWWASLLVSGGGGCQRRTIETDRDRPVGGQGMNWGMGTDRDNGLLATTTDREAK